MKAKKTLKSKLDRYRELRDPPSKRVKTTTPNKTLPGYQLPPTWDIPVTTSPSHKGDIRSYLRPLRRLPRPPRDVPQAPKEDEPQVPQEVPPVDAEHPTEHPTDPQEAC